MSQKLLYLFGSCLVATAIIPALALNKSIGEQGINARLLHEEPYNLLGRKIGIGQVEIGRPGKFGIDKAGAVNTTISPKKVFFQDKPAKSDGNIDNHATMVAGVMIARDKYLRGVAPEARLYTTAVGSLKEERQSHECLATQHIALQNGEDIRSINFSFGESLEEDLREDAKLDGKALLTKCIDWSARVHNVVYVIAGNQGNGGIPIPTDNYNGITTAYTTQREGKFVKVDFANLSDFPRGIGRSTIIKEINDGERRAIDLLAPGNNIAVRNQKGEIEKVSGTSFAAPHITASVALLQEAGDRNLINKIPNWSIDSRRHEVMKAILLNSADKIYDPGNGLLLGMEKTIINEKNVNWLESDAYINPRIPLDIQMGTGHLNVFRAYQQFNSGQYSPDKSVLGVGWDYNKVENNSYQDYYIEEPLEANSYAAITLNWDRLVELADLNGNGKYDIGEIFRDRGLNNLDIYLMPANEDNILRNTCSSVSLEDSTEHIFCPIPTTGKYKIRVDFRYKYKFNKPIQSYALAWWTYNNSTVK